jgi:hypothetical protein
MTMARTPAHSTQEAEMAKPPVRNDETTAERVVRDIEGHEDRVAERLLGQMYAVLQESLTATEARIVETGQIQSYAAAKAVEDKVGAMLGRHAETLMQATSDAVFRLTERFNAGLIANQQAVGDMLDQHTATTTHRIDNSAANTVSKLSEGTNTGFAANQKAVNDMLDKHTATTTQQIDNSAADTVSKLSEGINTGFAANQKAVNDMLDKHTATTAQQIDKSATALSGHFDQQIDALIPQLRDMLNTTEVSVLAKLLGLIDARLKAIEARLAGYAGPEQAAEEKAAAKRLADAKLAQAAELTQIADAAEKEAKNAANTADRHVEAEYEYLATRAKELAEQAQREAAELLA